MGNTAKYPLLIAGFYSDQNGGSSTLTAIGAGTRKNWTNTIQQSRGDLIMLDIVPSVLRLRDFQEAVFNLSIAGVDVIINGVLVNYQIQSFIRSYELLRLRQKAGQTLSLTAIGATGNAQGIVVHAYHENNCSTPEIIAARNKSVLKQRTFEQGGILLGGVKNATTGATYTIPKSMGNVVAVQFLCSDDAGGDNCAKTPISVSMGGTDILKNALAVVFHPYSGRPGLIFPILIRGGETFEISGDTSGVAVAAPVYVKLRFYFDEDTEGTKNYDLSTCTQQ